MYVLYKLINYPSHIMHILLIVQFYSNIQTEMNSFLGSDFRTGIIIWVNVSLIINIGLFVSGMLLVDKEILLTTMPTDMLKLPMLLKITFIWVFFCILNDVILSGALYFDVGKYYSNIWKCITALTLLLHAVIELYVLFKVGIYFVKTMAWLFTFPRTNL